jgi:hypothetical protein
LDPGTAGPRGARPPNDAAGGGRGCAAGGAASGGARGDSPGPRDPHDSRSGIAARALLGRLEPPARPRLRGPRLGIAVGTNILLYAHREESPWHPAASDGLARIARRRWAIPRPCVHAFLAIATQPGIFDPPSPLDAALRAVESWSAVPTTLFLTELDGYADVLASLLRETQVAGPRIRAGRIAALCQQHGVSELWTADRDFSRFPGLVTRSPLP